VSIIPTHEFRLYVAGDAPNSVLARHNLEALCRQHLQGRHRIELVDLVRQPERALSDSVMLTPTLVRVAPGQQRRIVGNLSDTDRLIQVLGLETSEA